MGKPLVEFGVKSEFQRLAEWHDLELVAFATRHFRTIIIVVKGASANAVAFKGSVDEARLGNTVVKVALQL